MERRKFLIGAGSLAAGSAAAMGTGALTSVKAERGLTVDVAGDGKAYLGMAPNTNSQFVETNPTGAIQLDFSNDSKNGGAGINNNAVTTVRPAFTLQNQSKSELTVEMDNPLRNNDLSSSQKNNDASGVGVTVPKGLDVQFIAVESASGISNSEKAAFIDRGTVPSPGPDFGSRTGQRTVQKQSGSGSITYQFIDEAGALVLSPGDEWDVITRVVTHGFDTEYDSVEDIANQNDNEGYVFGAEAYNETSATTFNPAYSQS